MLKLLLGDPNARKRALPADCFDINLLEEEIVLSDDQLRARTKRFRSSWHAQAR